MNKSLLLSVSLVALSTSAFSADLTIKPYQPVRPVAKPYSWTGFYGGAHIGYGRGNESDNQSNLFPAVQPTAAPTVAPTTPPTEPTIAPTLPPIEPTVEPTTPPPIPTTTITTTPIVPDDFVAFFKPSQDISNGAPVVVGNLINERLKPDGFVGGIHLGYNYQINQFVMGVEGDFDYSNIEDSNPFSYETINGPVSGTLKLRSNWKGSARVRAGYAFDNLLIYATGGVALADASLLTNGVGPSNTHIGWTAGGGIEYAFTQNWIGRIEARYTDFERKTYQTSLGPVRAKWDETTATLGISYKF